MKTTWLVGPALLLVIGWMARAGEEVRGVAKQILGTWTIVAGEKEGKKEPPERIKDVEVKITEDRIVVINKDATRSYTASYKLALKRKPYGIVMKVEEGPDKGKAAQGIFRLEGQSLTLCYALPGATAPNHFKTAPGDRRLLFVLRRAK